MRLTRVITPMNVIDIASWQHGIDLPKAFAQNPIYGVVVKASEGTTYVNADFAGWAKWLTDNGKLFGFYHYLQGADAKAEAEHFYNTTKAYTGRGIPVADYEGYALGKGADWLRQFLDRYYELTGVKAMIYCSLSVVQGLTGMTDHPLWIAQYADMAQVDGFLTTPWQKGSVAPWSKYWMHQYTSNGRLNGYNGALDFDKFYGTAEDWAMLSKGEKVHPSPAPAPALKPADPSIVLAVLKNQYGTEASAPPRSERLREAGYDPVSVQETINRLYGEAAKVKKDVGNDMDYLNAILWIVRS